MNKTTTSDDVIRASVSMPRSLWAVVRAEAVNKRLSASEIVEQAILKFLSESTDKS